MNDYSFGNRLLRLRTEEIRDVVKQELLEGIRHKLLQLAAGALQKYLFQRSDFTSDIDGHGIFPFYKFRAEMEIFYLV